MSDTENRLSYFIAFCVEQYKIHSHQNGSDVAKLFETHRVFNYLTNNFEILHTQGSSWLMAEIDAFINNQKRREC